MHAVVRIHASDERGAAGFEPTAQRLYEPAVFTGEQADSRVAVREGSRNAARSVAGAVVDEHAFPALLVLPLETSQAARECLFRIIGG